MTMDIQTWLRHCRGITRHYISIHSVRDGRCSCFLGAECSSPGKHPKGKWRSSHDSALSLHDLQNGLETGESNYGIALNEAGLVVDFDGEEGRRSFEYLRCYFPREMGSLSVITQSGGRHVFLRLPSGLQNIHNSTRVLPGVDLRSIGGFVVGPGSVGLRGHYCVVQENTKLIEASEQLLWAILCHPKFRQAKRGSFQLIPEGQRDTTLFKTLCGLRGRGLEPTELDAVAIGINAFCHPYLSHQQVKQKVEQASKYERGKDLPSDSGEKKRLPLQTQLVDSLREDTHNGRLLAFDTFRQRIVISNDRCSEGGLHTAIKPFEDSDLAKIRDEYARRLEASISADCASLAIEIVARENSFNSLEREFELLEWDNKPRVDCLFSAYFGAEESPSTRAISRIFLLSAIRRGIEPGCKVDTTVIIEGPQGIGKSQALKIIGGEHFGSPYLDLRNKDVFQQIQELWIIELPELASFEGKSANLIKSFLSTETDVYRPAYGRNSVSRPRSCIFVGTTNDDTFLTDPTGNRRFLPVFSPSIDLESLASDRDNLLAEAYARVKSGEQWWPTDEEQLRFAQNQEEKIVRDPWEDKLSEVFKASAERSWTNLELFKQLQIPTHSQDRSLQTRLGCLMKRIGFDRIPKSKPATYRPTRRRKYLQLCEPQSNNQTITNGAQERSTAGRLQELDSDETEVERLDDLEDLA